MDLPKRKHPRLKTYDYSQNGCYYVTICAENMKCYFGSIVRKPCSQVSVGRGLAPAEKDLQIFCNSYVKLSLFGRVAESQILQLEKQYPYVKIEKYVIMPNHIHILFLFDYYTTELSPRPTPSDFNFTAGASPRPTLCDIICTFKSKTTRLCNQYSGVTGRKIFQTSFYEKIIRDEKGFQEAWQYIEENPNKWKNSKYYK